MKALRGANVFQWIKMLDLKKKTEKGKNLIGS